MLYDNIDNIDDEYNPLEDTGSTAYWQNVWNKEKEEKEELEKKLSEEVDIYFKCNNPKCGYVVKTKEKVKLKDVEDIIESYRKTKCPKCGHSGFKQIDKKEFEKSEKEFKIKEKDKDKEKNGDKKYIKRTIGKIQEELFNIKEELVNDLEHDKITPERFSALMVNLSFNLYKYYKKDNILMPFWSDFIPLVRNFARDASKNALKKKYSYDELDNTLELVLIEYDDEVKRGDEIYLEYSKKIAEDQTIGKVGEELDEINSDIKEYEYQINQLKRYNEERKKMESILYTKQDKKDEKSMEKRFFDELRRNNK